MQQQIIEGLIVGLDSYYKLSRDMIDEGQFGAPIILTPFNYAKGKQYGAELTADYTAGNFNAYGQFPLEHAVGKGWITSQFSFDPPHSPTSKTTIYISITSRRSRRPPARPTNGATRSSMPT